MTPKQFDRIAQIFMILGIALLGFGARHAMFEQGRVLLGTTGAVLGIALLVASVWLTKFANGSKLPS